MPCHITVDGTPLCDSSLNAKLPDFFERTRLLPMCQHEDQQSANSEVAVLAKEFPDRHFQVVEGSCPRPREDYGD